MINLLRGWLVAGLGSWLLAAGGPAFATAVWTSGSGSCNADGNTYFSCPTTYTGAGGTGLTVSAISNTGASIVGGATLATAFVGYYNTSQWGVTGMAGPNAAASCANAAGSMEGACAPQTAIDNDGNSEFLLYSFGSAVKLSEVTLDWSQNDSDITVLAYQGGGAPPLTGGTTTYGGPNGLVAKGWTVVGNYSSVCGAGLDCGQVGGPATASVTPGTSISSSYWLIGAYNSLGGASLDSTADYVTILSVGGQTTSGRSAPEPSSMLLGGGALLSMLLTGGALLALGVLAFGALRRRRSA